MGKWNVIQNTEFQKKAGKCGKKEQMGSIWNKSQDGRFDPQWYQ